MKFPLLPEAAWSSQLRVWLCESTTGSDRLPASSPHGALKWLDEHHSLEISGSFSLGQSRINNSLLSR